MARMDHRPTYLTYLLTLFLFTTAAISRKFPERVLLSSVKALTLRKDLLTTHNRVSAVPQLKCIGGSAKGLYDIDVLRCKNQGSSYGDEDIQWTCSASLPSEFKLGSTDVICEGFKSSDDPYVLKGSCGVEYRLMLTDVGEEKYGHKKYKAYDNESGGKTVAVLFWLVFVAVLCWIAYASFFGNPAQRRIGNPGPGFFGGGGGGGNGGGGNDDPPPPYDYHPSAPKPKSYPRAAPAREQTGYRPGFWTGALGGAAAGYAAGNRGQSRNAGPNLRNDGNGEGSSRWGSGGRSSSSSSMGSSPGYGSSRHESSGFGGTSRR